jgi:hypothetical protein
MSGLDETTGSPTMEKLAELDIPWVWEELAGRQQKSG